MSGHTTMADALFAGHGARCRYYPATKRFNCAPECEIAQRTPQEPAPARTIDKSGDLL